MEHTPNPRRRLYLLAGLFLAVMVIYAGVLYNTQILHHDYYFTQSIRDIAQSEDVEASRGIITDRHGRPLVSNRSSYDLTFDASVLEEGQENQAILRLVQLCQSQHIPWVDNLPISRTEPFTYTLSGMSDLYQKRFFTYVKSLKPAKKLLAEYLQKHPDAVPKPKEPFPEEDDEDNELALGEFLLEQMSWEDFSAQLLNSAGLPARKLVKLMGGPDGFDIPADFTPAETRLVLGVQYELSIRKLMSSPAYVLAEDIDTVMISLINDGHYDGARITSSSVREYETTYGAHILGTVGPIFPEEWEEKREELKEKGYRSDDRVGRSGVESAFEDYLRGQDGQRIVSSNKDGKVTGVYYSKEPVPGNTVELTIDLPLQKAAEDALADTISRMNQEKPGLGAVGAATVVKVGTGEVLALASYPTYNLATYREDYAKLSADPSQPFLNRATQGRYPPGSTMKPLTSTAALEEHVITPEQRISCPAKWHYPGGGPNDNIWCWKRYGSHGMLNVTDAITASCNYFFAEMGYRLGMDKLTKYMSAFGFGQPTGIEIGDSAGTLPKNNKGEDQAPWAAMGQSNQLVTPLQLSNYIATLVSGGQHNKTHLLKAVKSYDNSQVIALGETEPVSKVDISPSTLKAVKDGMHGLTKGSLAPYFRSCVVEAGAKTGTAQLGGGKVNNGVFVCFAPFDKPEIAVSVAIEKGGAGAALASTAVAILNAYFTADNAGIGISGEHTLLP